MGNRYSTRLLFKISILLVIILLVGLVFSGCRGVSTVPKGWSGGVIVNGTLFVGGVECG